MSEFGDAAVRVTAGAVARAEAQRLVGGLTDDELIDLLDGDVPFWPGITDMTSGGYYTHAWPAARNMRLGIPGLAFTDGPRGVVIGNATCFPVAMARAASFDLGLEEAVGDVIGREARASGATYFGGVCVNLLRHPAWGRAQETYGEDPHQLGEFGAALTRGVQRHVMACVKHFACNSMENARFRVDVTADARALHEVYLPHFRRVVEEGVASVMSAYNSLNGEWCGESPALLTGVLRDEWGFDGFVITDFIFGLRDPVTSVRAGLDVEMPFAQQRANELRRALAAGEITRAELAAPATRVVATLLRFDSVLRAPAPPIAVVASPAHRALARRAAQESIVLLTNRDALVPVDAAALRSVAVLGRLAAVANLGDGGSSAVHPPSAVTPLEGVRAALPGADVVHHDTNASIARDADLVVVVVGYTKADEGEFVDPSTSAELFAHFPPMDDPRLGRDAPMPELPPAPPTAPLTRDEAVMATGGDRRSLRLRPDDEALVAAAAALNDRTVVAVMAGSAVVMPWIAAPAATLVLWYPGMEGGHAFADVLFGAVAPGGRLPFAIPRAETDLVHFDPDATTETYDGFHGQWHLHRTGTAAAFPFGFGLSTTTFAMQPDAAYDASTGAVTVTVVNSGTRDAATVVQVYGGYETSAYERPASRLVGFARVEIAAGASTAVRVPVDLRMLDVRVDGAMVREPGPIRLRAAFHADDPGEAINLRQKSTSAVEN